MATIAALIARALRERDSGEELAAVREEVAELCARFPAYPDGDPHLRRCSRSTDSAATCEHFGSRGREHPET